MVEQDRNPGNQLTGALQIVEVDGRATLNDFIRLPWSIYRDDPVWVPPLLFERRRHLSPSNPYFEHARCRFWIVYRGSKAVGRISAQIDQLHLHRNQDATGFWGMLEAEDDPDVFRALMNTVETWLRDQDVRRICGPFNLSTNQECGLLVDGFEKPPMVMMGHAPPYYGTRLEEQEYSKIKDLLAFIVNIDYKLSPAMQAIIRRYKKHIHTRQIRYSDLEDELQIIRDIYEDAWSQNWGFIPFTEKEIHHMGRDLKLLVPEDFVQIAEIDGHPVAMTVGFPDINEAIWDLNGRLLPLGWLKLLWRLKVRFPKTVRVALMGVRKEFQKSLLGAALALIIIEALRTHGLRRGVQQAELSWILEDNMGMRNIVEDIGAKIYKTYRIYGKALY